MKHRAILQNILILSFLLGSACVRQAPISPGLFTPAPLIASALPPVLAPTGLPTSVPTLVVESSPTPSLEPLPSLSPTSASQVYAPLIHAARDCRINFKTDEKPSDPAAASFPAEGWYRNSDGTIWAAPAPGFQVHTGENKFAWSRPAGSDLQISGQRLDRQAPPLKASLPEGYPGSFQASSLIFPTEGCWEIMAQAGPSSLQFVLSVEPSPHPPAGGQCDSLSSVVAAADAIVLGTVSASDLHGNYSWQTVDVWDVWKSPFSGQFANQIDLLQDTQKETGLQTGQTYLLFLQYEPWVLLCPVQTVGVIQGEQIQGIQATPGVLWSGRTVKEVQAEIQSFISNP